MLSGLRLPLSTLLALSTLALGATDAAAQAQVGQPFTPLAVQTYPNVAEIGIYLGQNTIDEMNAAGGVTLFAASAPNGPILARIAYTAPFVRDPNELNYVYSWAYHGVPAGTYYVTVILGIVATPNIAANQWAQVVVPGGCSSAPGIGLVNREATTGGPNAVQIRLAAWGGCATSFLVDVGTTPGSANVTSFEQSGGALAAAGVPAGNYYVRVRGKNALGVGPYSTVLPVAVPACSTLDEADYGLQASVAGNQVTLSWTPGPTPPPGGPITFYEAALFTPSVPIEAWPRVLLPTLATSVTAPLPSGPHTVAIIAGNACGSWMAGVVAFTIP